ncbi:hypothetical protein FRB94_013087 [Tulasnella sp. JGI-2019a]|nr:hypothetical protein FRB94_013087 [Tulasnella sp. JGI-2019a]
MPSAHVKSRKAPPTSVSYGGGTASQLTAQCRTHRRLLQQQPSSIENIPRMSVAGCVALGHESSLSMLRCSKKNEGYRSLSDIYSSPTMIEGEAAVELGGARHMNNLFNLKVADLSIKGEIRSRA